MPLHGLFYGVPSLSNWSTFLFLAPLFHCNNPLCLGIWCYIRFAIHVPVFPCECLYFFLDLRRIFLFFNYKTFNPWIPLDSVYIFIILIPPVRNSKDPCAFFCLLLFLPIIFYNFYVEIFKISKLYVNKLEKSRRNWQISRLIWSTKTES